MKIPRLKSPSLCLWIARLLIGVVFALNVQCALAFLIAPSAFAPGFELSSAVGDGAISDGMVRGLGILFLMWNVPYAVALSDPVRRSVSLWEACGMQVIGLTGETFLLLTFPAGHPAVRETVVRFILFDGLGLVALGAALWITLQVRRAVLA